MTLDQLAKTFSAAKSTFSGYENDYRKPDMDTICNIADFFGVSVDFLLCRTDIRLIKDTKTVFTHKEFLNAIPEKYKDILTAENLPYIDVINRMRKEDITPDMLEDLAKVILKYQKEDKL